MDAKPVGFETMLEKVPPVTKIAMIPATIAQMMLHKSTTKPRPKANPQPTIPIGSGRLDI